jgi:hypothetical protein
MNAKTQAPKAEQADERIDVHLDEIHLTIDTQARVAINDYLVNEYAEAMAAEEQFPPVVLFRDAEGYWIGDGFHRIKAAQQLKRDTIVAEVRAGSLREAFLYACSANATHGLRRDDLDKRHVVNRLLTDEEWSRWSDREIARRCAVSHPFVGKLRAELEERRARVSGNGYQIPETRMVHRGESTYTMDTSRLNLVRGASDLANGTGAGPDPREPSKYQQAKERRRAREQAELMAKVRQAVAQLPRPFVEALEVIQSHLRAEVRTLPPDRQGQAVYFLDSQLQSTVHTLALQLQHLWETYVRLVGKPEGSADGEQRPRSR